MDEIRPSVARFAEEMEAVLRENDYKGGWEECSIHYLLERLHDELDELESGVGTTRSYRRDLEKEAIDVANFAMMIYENIRSQNQKEKDDK